MKKAAALSCVASAAILCLALAEHTFAATGANVVAWDGNGTVQTNVPPDLTNAVAVAAGYAHGLALRADGTVVAWGDNTYGQTNVPDGLSNVVAIAAAGFHNLALRTDGTIVAWGTNYFGESTVPRGLDRVVSIASGLWHNLALRADGTVVAWGTNQFGETTVPPGLNNVVAIAAGDAHSLVLRADGTVVSWGAYLGLEYWYSIGAPPGLNNVVAIAAGAGHCLALKADGTLVAWGDSQYVPAGLSNVVAIAAFSHNLALRADGTVAAFGFGQGVPLGLSNVVAIADGAYSLGIVGAGQAAPGPPLVERAVAQGAGTAIFYAPAVGAWPLSYQWQCNGTNLPNATNAWLVLTTPPPLDAGLYSVTVSNSWGTALTQAGRLNVAPAVFSQPPLDQVAYLWGTASFPLEAQASPPVSFQWRFNGKDLTGETNSALVLSNLTRGSQGPYSVVVSNQFGTALSPAARLWIVNVAGWGNNGWGNNTTVFPLYGGQAVAPASLSNAVAISAGEAHSLALRADGTVVAWGLALRADGTQAAWGQYRHFDPSSVQYQMLPMKVPPAPGWPFIGVPFTAIGSGASHCLAVLEGDTVWGVPLSPIVLASGENRNGQANVPSSLSDPWVPDVVAVDGGDQHSLALRADGSVVAWGDNSLGQTNVPVDLHNAIAIAAGGLHNLALFGEGPPALGVTLSTPALSNEVFSVSLPSQSGRVYALQYKNSLDDTLWRALPLVAGNGGTLTLTDATAATSGTRYYRVLQW